MKLDFVLPADASSSRVLSSGPLAATRNVYLGLPADLQIAFADKPLLADSISSAHAAASSRRDQSYQVLFTAVLPDHERVISEALLFRREAEITLIPLFERIDRTLQTRTKETKVLLTLPADTLPAGRYEVTLVGSKSSRTWELELN